MVRLWSITGICIWMMQKSVKRSLHLLTHILQCTTTLLTQEMKVKYAIIGRGFSITSSGRFSVVQANNAICYFLDDCLEKAEDFRTLRTDAVAYAKILFEAFPRDTKYTLEDYEDLLSRFVANIEVTVAADKLHFKPRE